MGHSTGVCNFEHLDALVRLYRVAMGTYQCSGVHQILGVRYVLPIMRVKQTDRIDG
jgi:hypothetical protein